MRTTERAARWMWTAAAALAAWQAPRSAEADRVVLKSGAAIEGKATASGDTVVIEVGSGELRLPADEVVRIEESESDIERFHARYEKLHAGDVRARLALADYCRDHGMRAREQQLLREILEIDGEHERARLRLGYVKTEAGWVTEAEAMRDRGFVWQEGRWMTPAEALELERLRAATEAAKTERDKAKVELESKQVALSAERAALAADSGQPAGASADVAQTPPVTPAVYFTPDQRCVRGRDCGARKSRKQAFPIVGVRDPRDATFSTPGVRDPLEAR